MDWGAIRAGASGSQGLGGNLAAVAEAALQNGRITPRAGSRKDGR